MLPTKIVTCKHNEINETFLHTSLTNNFLEAGNFYKVYERSKFKMFTMEATSKILRGKNIQIVYHTSDFKKSTEQTTIEKLGSS